MPSPARAMSVAGHFVSCMRALRDMPSGFACAAAHPSCRVRIARRAAGVEGKPWQAGSVIVGAGYSTGSRATSACRGDGRRMTTTRARRHAMIHATPSWRWLAAVLALSFATASVAGPPPLIPMPAAIAMADGERTVDADTVLRFDDDRAAPTVHYFSDLLERTLALRLETE